MKKLFIILTSIAFFTANGQTVDEIIQKHNTAMGGLEAFNKVTTAKLTGVSGRTGRDDFRFTIQLINGKAMRIDSKNMDNSITQVYKEGKGWHINPFMNIETATDAEGYLLSDFKSMANLKTNLMDYKIQGNQAELLGQEDIEGIKTYKIKVTDKYDGRISIFFINSTDYLLNKTMTSHEMMGQSFDIETYYRDAKEFGGLKFYITRNMEARGQEFGTLILTNVELNVPVDEKIFTK
jgi:hypothetical protein